MIKSTEDFGNLIEKTVKDSPEKARRLLLLGYRLFGMKLRWLPDKRLPLSRQKSALYLNQTIRKVFTEPENTAIVNIFMPCEILEALDVVPLCAEMFSCFINGTCCEQVFVNEAERLGISETYCSFHKTLLGTAYLDLLRPPIAVINTSFVCDANQLTFRELSKHLNVPHCYIEVPSEQSEEAIRYVSDELKKSARLLEEAAGKKLDEDKLKLAVDRSNKSAALFKKILAEKSDKYLPCDITSEMYETYLVHNGIGTEMCYDYAKTLYNDFKTAKKFNGIKILWLHIVPLWQAPIRELFDFNERCQIITCDMNFDSLTDADPERPYESMAKRLLSNSWRTGNSRVEKAVRMGKELRVDGAVCFCQWGCKQTMGLSGLFQERFEDENIPVLVLDGDCVDRRNASDGQVSTRLNAFIEMLEGKRNGK